MLIKLLEQFKLLEQSKWLAARNEICEAKIVKKKIFNSKVPSG